MSLCFLTIVVVIAVAVVVFVVVCGYCSRCRFGLFFCVVLLHAGLNDGDDDLGHRRGSKLAAAIGWIGGCHRILCLGVPCRRKL